MIVKLYRTAGFVAVLAVLAAIGYAMGSLIELTIMLVSFLMSKRKYEFKYHCKSVVTCLFVSVSVFMIGMRVTLPIGVSYVCSAFCGMVIAYISQHIAESKFIREDYTYIEPRYNALVEEKRKISIYTMGEAQLREFCKGRFLDEIDEEIVVQRLIYHRKGKDLYDKIGYSKPQMVRREHRIEEQLGIRLK